MSGLVYKKVKKMSSPFLFALPYLTKPPFFGYHLLSIFNLRRVHALRKKAQAAKNRYSQTQEKTAKKQT